MITETTTDFTHDKKGNFITIPYPPPDTDLYKAVKKVVDPNLYFGKTKDVT